MAVDVNVSSLHQKNTATLIKEQLNGDIRKIIQSPNKASEVFDLYKKLGKNVFTTTKVLGTVYSREFNKTSTDQKTLQLTDILSKLFAGDHTKTLGTEIFNKLLSPKDFFGIGISPKAEIPIAKNIIRRMSDALQKPLEEVVEMLVKQGVKIDQDTKNIILEAKNQKNGKANGLLETNQPAKSKDSVFGGSVAYGVLVNDGTKVIASRAQDKSEREDNPKDIALEKIIAQVPLIIDNSKEFGVNKMAQIVDKFAEYVG